MKLNLFKISALAFASLALVATSANATISYTSGTASTGGDLLLGFDNQGSNDYVVDLGLASDFLDVTGTETIAQITGVNIGSISTDLSSSGLFGSGWYASTTKWGAAADDQSGNINQNADIIYITNPSATSYGDLVNASTAIGDIETIGAGLNGASTANSAVADKQASSGGGSWANFESTANGGTGTGSGSGSLSTYLPGITTGVTSKLYLDETFDGDTAAGKTLGYFSITNAGALTFTAVPEPSTYALMVLGGLMMLGWKLRRRNA